MYVTAKLIYAIQIKIYFMHVKTKYTLCMTRHNVLYVCHYKRHFYVKEKRSVYVLCQNVLYAKGKHYMHFMSKYVIYHR